MKVGICVNRPGTCSAKGCGKEQPALVDGKCWPCAYPRVYWTPEFWASCRPNHKEAECSTSGSE